MQRGLFTFPTTPKTSLSTFQALASLLWDTSAVTSKCYADPLQAAILWLAGLVDIEVIFAQHNRPKGKAQCALKKDLGLHVQSI